MPTGQDHQKQRRSSRMPPDEFEAYLVSRERGDHKAPPDWNDMRPEEKDKYC